MRPKSFKKFVEEKEKEASSPHLDALGDELGIDARDMEKEPMVGSFFSMGKETRNIGPYKIVSLKRNDEGQVTHALVKKIDDRAIKNRKYIDDEGEMKSISGDGEDETMLVPIEDLDKLLSQDFQPPDAAAGGVV